MKLGSGWLRIIAIVLISTLLSTQNLCYAVDKLTATIAAANSETVRSTIENELGLSRPTSIASDTSRSITVRRIDSFRSELRSQDRSSRHSFKWVANGHIRRHSVFCICLTGFFFLPLAYASLFAVPRADLADWSLLMGYAMGTAAFFSVSMELISNWIQTRSAFVINSFEHRYVKGQRVRLTDFNISDLQLLASAALILFGSFLRYSGVVWFQLIQLIAIVVFFASPIFTTPERNVATRAHVKDQIRANTTLIGQLSIPVFFVLLTALFEYLGLLNQMQGLYYLMPIFIVSLAVDAWSKWHAAAHSPFAGSSPMYSGVLRGDLISGQLDHNGSPSDLHSIVMELLEHDPDIEDMIEEIVRSHNLTRFIFDERQGAEETVLTEPVQFTFSVIKDPSGEFGKRYGIPKGNAIFMIRMKMQNPERKIESAEAKPILLAQLRQFANRSELRMFHMPADHYAALGLMVFGVAGAVWWSGLKQRAAKKKAINDMIERIYAQLHLQNINAIDIKWLDLRGAARFLNQETDEEQFVQKMALLVRLILKLIQLLEPRPGGAGYGKAIESNSGMQYDIKSLLNSAWLMQRQEHGFYIELTPRFQGNLLVYRPQLKRSELRKKVIDQFAAGIIDRFVNAPIEFIGAKVRMSSGTVETQLRRKDVFGRPVNLDRIEIPDELYRLFPAELGDEALYAIDIIPSEDMPEEIIKPHEADDYKRRLAAALNDLLSIEGIARLNDLAADRKRNASFWLDSDHRFEVMVGHFPRNPGVFMNIYIHPKMEYVPRSKYGVVKEMISRFVRREASQTTPFSVDLVMQGARNGDFVISNYEWMNEETLERSHRNRRLINPEPASILVVPQIDTGNLNGGKNLRLTFVSLYAPPKIFVLSEEKMDELERELVSILETLALVRYDLTEGQSLRDYLRTPHFSVKIGRSGRNGGTYYANIHFYLRTEAYEAVHNYQETHWNAIKSDITLASSLIAAQQFQAARLILSRVLDMYPKYVEDPVFLKHEAYIVDHFSFYASSMATNANGDSKMISLAEGYADIVKSILQKSEEFSQDAKRHLDAVGTISQVAAMFIRLNNVKKARAMLSHAKVLFQKAEKDGNTADLKLRAIHLLIHYVHLMNQYLDRTQDPASGLENIGHARAMLENAVFFLPRSDTRLIELASTKSFEDTLVTAVKDAEFLLSVLGRNSNEAGKRTTIISGRDALKRFLDEFRARKPRSELRLIQSELFAARGIQIETALSGSRKGDRAFIVSRSLAFEKGMLPVFAAMSNQGIRIAIIAPSVSLDQKLIGEMNQLLDSDHQILIGRSLSEAAAALARKTSKAQLIFVKGSEEGRVVSEQDFADRYSGEIVELNDNAINELRMSVRGLAQLMDRTRAIYEQIYQAA